ncbi:hypothetical protein BMS3Abin15_00844 [bacterium BMS3Abin15]|nr:hypothetical protein BMS3Abin15_00844 [bacterium BMS3Abin15]
MITQDNNNLEIKMIDSITETGVGSIIENGIEISIDSIINEELLKEVPVVKSVVAISRGVLGVRDYLFLKKIIGFLTEIEKGDLEKRKKFVEEIKNNDKVDEIGSKLIEIIDKSIGEYKARIIGRLFVVFLKNEEVTQEDFFRLSEIVTSAYESDLKYFLKTKENIIGETGDEVEHLLTVGLYERKKNAFGGTVIEAKKPTLSSHGRIFKKIL